MPTYSSNLHLELIILLMNLVRVIELLIILIFGMLRYLIEKMKILNLNTKLKLQTFWIQGHKIERIQGMYLLLL